MKEFSALIAKEKIENDPVKSFSLITDEKQITHGCIFIIAVKNRDYKVFIPAPHHKNLIPENNTPKIKEILAHKEAMLLK